MTKEPHSTEFMPKHNDITEEERELFRQTVGPITPIKSNPRVKTSPSKTPPKRVKQPHFPEAAVVLETDYHLELVSPEDRLFFYKPGIVEKTLKQLKKGQLRCERQLDLHNLTIEEAEEKLHHFLSSSHEAGLRCVRIIHGKGYSSRAPLPILKNQVNNWLRHHPLVLAFSSAKPADGGTGAVYVLIKR